MQREVGKVNRSDAEDAADPGVPVPGKRTLGAIDPGVRAPIEQSLGADFADVQVHEGPEAPLVGARAYAQGNALHFAPGAYDPGSADGRTLLAHELAHVVQQRSGSAPPSTAGGPPIDGSASHEHEADAAAASVARGERAAALSPASGAGVQRMVGPGLAPGTRLQRVGLGTRVRVRRHDAERGGYVVDAGGAADVFYTYAQLEPLQLKRSAEGPPAPPVPVPAAAAAAAATASASAAPVADGDDEATQQKRTRKQLHPQHLAPPPPLLPAANAPYDRWQQAQEAFLTDRAAHEGGAPQPSAAHLAAARATSALVGSHIASHQVAQFGAPAPIQEHPGDVRAPDTYFRSQARSAMLTNTGGKKTDVRPQMSAAFEPMRNPRYPLSGPNSGHVGLREDNFTMAERSLTDESVQRALTMAGRTGLVTPSTIPSPAAAAANKPDDGPLMDQLGTTQTALHQLMTATPLRPAEYPSADPRRYGESFIERRQARSSIAAHELIELLRGAAAPTAAAAAAPTAAAAAASLATATEHVALTNVIVEHTIDNTSLTLYLSGLADAGIQGDRGERITEWVQAWFAGRGTAKAAELGLPLAVQPRQSFGFLETTVANTAMSIRLSMGSEPRAFLAALAASIRELDVAVGTLAAHLAALPADDAMATAPKWNTTSEQRKYAGYYRAVSNQGGAANIIDFARWVVGKSAADMQPEREVPRVDGEPKPKHEQRTHEVYVGEQRLLAASAYQEKLRAAQAAAAAKPAPAAAASSSPAAAAAAAPSLPIQEDVEDATMMAHGLLQAIAAAPNWKMPYEAMQHMTVMQSAAERLLQTLGMPIGTPMERSATHIRVLGPLQELLAATQALAGATDAYAGRDPQAETAARVQQYLPNASTTYMDSGMQAIAGATFAQMPAGYSAPAAEKQKRVPATNPIAVAPSARSYFEVPNVKNALPPAMPGAKEVRIDTAAPYLATPNAVQPQPGLANPTIVDATNIDPLSKRHLQQLAQPPAAAGGGASAAAAAGAQPAFTVASLVKHGQLGFDHLQQGVAIDNRPPDQRPRAVPSAPLSRHGAQFVSMINDLRDANALDVMAILGKAKGTPYQNAIEWFLSEYHRLTAAGLPVDFAALDAAALELVPKDAK
ncbi:MAG TPA: DUF4157 domain-containing protein [Kofleriaceae bacterium]|jgi:hypothetical protein